MALLNFMMYIALMIYSLRYHRNNYLLFFVIGMWLFSSFIGVIYVNLDVFRDGINEIEFLPFVYLIFAFSLFLLPIFRIRNNVNAVLCKSSFFLDFFSSLVGIIAIWPFIELVLKLSSSIATGEYFLLGSLYDDIASGNEDPLIEMTWIGNKLKILCGYFKVISPVLMIYYISKYPKKHFIILGLFASSFILPLDNLRIGGKTQIVFYWLNLMCLYLFLRKTFSTIIRKKIRYVMLFFTVFVMSNIIILSISRYYLTERVETVSESGNFIFKYTAESMFNFNQNAFHEKNTLGGYSTLTPIMETLGISAVDTNNGALWYKLSDYISKRMKGPSVLFYTLIGDLYLDFGGWFTIIVILIIAILFSLIKIKKEMKLHNILLFSIYIQILSSSLFYFCFKLSYAPIFVAVLLSIVLEFFDHPKQRYAQNRVG